jgi:tRNA-2-methylthio-N6-dimethylallyladenosine synthase
LGRWKELKQHKASVVIGVGGCVASQEGEAIVRRAPHVDLVFGPQTLHRLPEMIEARRSSGKPQVDISFPEIEKFDRLPEPRAEGPTAFVSIMEGCSKYCSFCIVPYTRGEEVSPTAGRRAGRSRTGWPTQGVREVTLLGQNVNAYRGATKHEDGTVGSRIADPCPCRDPMASVASALPPRTREMEFGDSLIAAYATRAQAGHISTAPARAIRDPIASLQR